MVRWRGNSSQVYQGHRTSKVYHDSKIRTVSRLTLWYHLIASGSFLGRSGTSAWPTTWTTRDTFRMMAATEWEEVCELRRHYKEGFVYFIGRLWYKKWTYFAHPWVLWAPILPVHVRSERYVWRLWSYTSIHCSQQQKTCGRCIRSYTT